MKYRLQSTRLVSRTKFTSKHVETQIYTAELYFTQFVSKQKCQNVVQLKTYIKKTVYISPDSFSNENYVKA
ncbi:hypothetical protein Hanom_Chr01g00006381 [Helianthus anomalus]